jgi:hypothetical protein
MGEIVMAQEDEKAKSDERSLTDKDVRRIANRLLVTWGLPSIALAMIGFGLFVYKSGNADKATVWWFIVAVTLLVISFIQGLVFNNESKVIHDHVLDKVADASNEITKAVREIVTANVDPHVTMLTSQAQVRSEAAKLMEQAVKDTTSSLGIYYFGSASLSPSKEEVAKATDPDNPDHAATARYNSALEDLTRGNTRVVRFIYLFEDEAFKLRNQDTRAKYLSWLALQAARLKTSPSYFLYNARRAPEWGGPRSSIVTQKGILDIIGNGEAGLLLISERIPTALHKHSWDYFYAAARPENKPVSYGTDKAGDLQAMVERLTKLHENLLTGSTTTPPP